MDRGSGGWVLVVEEAALPRCRLAQVPVCPSRKSYISGACSPAYLLHGGLSPTGSCVEDVQSPHLSVFSV